MHLALQIHLLFTEASSEMVSVEETILEDGKLSEKAEECQIIQGLD